MSWRTASERRIGSYIWWDSLKESAEILPLLWCLSFWIVNDSNRLEAKLHGILTGDESAPSGGDPGWVLYQDRIDNGQLIYHAWTHADVSGLDPCEGDYDEATVRFHVRRTLDNFRIAHPERSEEVEEVIGKYGL